MPQCSADRRDVESGWNAMVRKHPARHNATVRKDLATPLPHCQKARHVSDAQVTQVT
jgi:hypothetical protein